MGWGGDSDGRHAFEAPARRLRGAGIGQLQALSLPGSKLGERTQRRLVAQRAALSQQLR